MRDIFENLLSLFYEIENKARIAKKMTSALDIRRKDLLDFKLLEKMIGRKITESEKDKLHILYNSIDDDDRHEFVCYRMALNET